MNKFPTHADKIMWDYDREQREKNKPRRNIHFDKEVYNLGKEWAEAGKNLDEAPKEMTNNYNFINGFNHGERLKIIANLVENSNNNPKKR